MNQNRQESHGNGFAIGLFTGTVLGVGLALWLAPDTATEIRTRVTDSVDDLTRKGNHVRDDVASSVARGAREVERFATAAKSDAGKARS